MGFFFRSVATKNAFGNKKNDKYPDGENETVFQKIYDFIKKDNMKLSPGVFNIPVCGIEEVVDNWKRKTAGQDVSWEAFPCNEVK